MRLPILFLLAHLTATAAEPIRATLQPAKDRKPAPAFSLRDAKGKTVSINNYRGHVVLLDFWATWCHGCKEEIPWFSEFQETYRAKGLAVVGISVDEGGWDVLEPFLRATHVPYRMLLGSDATMQSFGLTGLPDTFLIDRKGRIAATYSGGLVDRGDLEVKIRELLAQ
jgi:peroxiredoxin